MGAGFRGEERSELGGLGSESVGTGGLRSVFGGASGARDLWRACTLRTDFGCCIGGNENFLYCRNSRSGSISKGLASGFL
jgi:hypothetical protein